jgi:TonB family protein
MFARSRPVPFVISLLSHGVVLAWVASGPVHEKPHSVYQQEIAPHVSKLVWYRFRDRLPDVSPTDAPPAQRPPQIEFKNNSQEIVAGSAKSPRARQFVWQPAPKLQLKQDLQSPNLLAMRVPHVDPLPKPKLFTPPAEVPRPTPAKPVLAAPPELHAAAIAPQNPLRLTLATPAQPKPKEFIPPELKKSIPAAPSLIEAPPEVHMARNLSGPGTIGNTFGARPARPQPRRIVLPRAGQAGAGPGPALPAPPPVQSAANLGSVRPPIAGDLAKPVRRTFVPPSAGTTTGRPKPSPFGAAVPDAPALPASALHSGVNVAVVGLNPSPNVTVPLPEGSRDARFSAGPKVRAEGGTEGAGQGGVLFVPGLTIRNGPRDAPPTLVARAAPTSQENLRAAVRERAPDPLPNEEHPLAPRVASAPDPMLAGRAFYAMTVQMPNITSYTGSWMIWFAEREQQFGESAGVSPPVPLHKVDPKYIASAVEDRVEGKVRLAAVIRKDGHVDSVRLLRHLDERLDQSAEEAMHKWEFEPALRNGKPVEVDAVIEIPFRLAPKVAR